MQPNFKKLNKIPIYVVHLETRDTYRLKVKGWKKIFHANRDQKKAGVAILISDKIDFKTKIKHKQQILKAGRESNK